MAVPKKRTSKKKSRSRKAVWKKQALYESRKAFSLAKTILSKNSSSFVYTYDDNIMKL